MTRSPTGAPRDRTSPDAAGRPARSDRREPRCDRATARRRGAVAALGLLIALALPDATAFAQQAVERHPVPVTPSRPGAIVIDAATYGSDDTTPYGVNLSGVTLIGEADAVSTRPSPGIATTAAPAPDGKEAIRAALGTALSPFLGKPLSAHEVAALQAAVAGVYRSFGLPFVSVTAPPQEITAGVVQLRVIAFRAGKVTVAGAGGRQIADASSVEDGVRLRAGETIDARRLSEDIDWLNRTPYRRVGAVFSPGEATALTNLALEVTEGKPWSASLGWSNGGSSANGLQRYSIGGGVWLPAFGGTSLSYLMTMGDDFLAHPDRVALTDGHYPAYLSHAAQIVVPIGARRQISFTPDLVVTRRDLDGFTSIQNLTFELPFVYRTAVSNLLPGAYWGDLYGGVAFKGLERKVLLSGTTVTTGHAGLMQFTLGWADTITDRLGETALDFSLVGNPGATVGYSDDAAWSSYTNGRVTRGSYVYGVVNVTRRTTLPPLLGRDGFVWVSQFTGMISDAALPDTERFALGGGAGSRGYGFSDVAVDRGAIWRNELRLPTVVAPSVVPMTASLSPYLFADAAWGQDVSTKATERLISLGAGADLALSGNLTGSVGAGRAMTEAGSTKAGDWSVLGKMTLKF